MSRWQARGNLATEHADATTTSATRSVPRPRDAAALGAFTLFWLLPVLYHGLSGARPLPGLPDSLYHLSNVSCLFSNSMPIWPFHYIQVRQEEDGPWLAVAEGEYFAMPAFGHRNRFDELARRDMTERAWIELLAWIRRRYEERHPGRPALVGARVVWSVFIVGEPIPKGHWRKPPIESVPPDRLRVKYEVAFGPPLGGAAASRAGS